MLRVDANAVLGTAEESDEQQDSFQEHLCTTVYHGGYNLYRSCEHLMMSNSSVHLKIVKFHPVIIRV